MKLVENHCKFATIFGNKALQSFLIDYRSKASNKELKSDSWCFPGIISQCSFVSTYNIKIFGI